MDALSKMAVNVGDICSLEVDAIVNAANTSLLGGGGVDGAIHKAAGPELLTECRALRGCAVGNAKITRGYRLPADYVIHTVGPKWRGGAADEGALLERCYRRSLEIAADRGINSLAFPAISTGVYGFPADQASKIAINSVANFLGEDGRIQSVVFCCFGAASAALHQAELERLQNSTSS